MSKLSVMSKLQDEEPDVGVQVSEAMAPIVEKMHTSNQALATMLSKSIGDALYAVESKTITVEDKPIRRWVFDFERLENGTLKRIVATSE